MPLAGEEGVVACRLQHRTQRPFGCWQAAALALKRHSCHAASVRDAACLDGGATGRATRLCVERQERHAFTRQSVEAWCWHAAVLAAPIGTGVSITEIIGQDQDDVGFLSLRIRWSRCAKECDRRK